MSSCSAASRREAPPSTRAITRMRMSAEYAFGIVRPPDESMPPDSPTYRSLGTLRFYSARTCSSSARAAARTIYGHRWMRASTRACVRLSRVASHMDGALIDRQCRLLHRLGERRVGVAGAGDVLGRGAELHGNRSLRDHVAGVRADDVHAQHAVGLGIGEDLHEALGLQVRLCTAIGGKGKFAGIVGDAGLL